MLRNAIVKIHILSTVKNNTIIKIVATCSFREKYIKIKSTTWSLNTSFSKLSEKNVHSCVQFPRYMSCREMKH